MLVYGIYRIGTPDVENKLTNIIVSANEIYEDYSSNEVSAESRYDDNVVEITGEVAKVSRTWLMGTILQESTVYLDGGSGYIHVIVQDQHKGEITNLATGDLITIKGKVDGFRGGGLIIKKGSILPTN
ncbi:OB-fold protein [Neobacillus sp. Marseille-QA0830]